MNNRLIKSNDAGGGACTNTVDLYNPFPDGGGVALYQLNGDATDVSGNYDGTATNVTYGAGQFGQAGVFNGSSSKIRTSVNVDNISHTFSCWIKTTQTSDGWIISNRSASGSTQYTGFYNNNGNIELNIAGSTSVSGSGTATNGNWQHCVMTFDNSTSPKVGKLYVDNVLVQHITTTTAVNSGLNVDIGVLVNSVDFFNGSIDQVRIFNRALRPYEVEALYTEEYCTPTIVPSEHFNTVTYTGNDADTGYTRQITGVGFQPDFVWIKDRDNGAFEHALFDSVRGAGADKILSSNLTSAEGWSTAAPFSSFDSDGFSVQPRSPYNANNLINKNGEDFVAWNFKAGGAAVTNTDGTITSQVSANTEAGFSVVSYTGNGVIPSTYGHGLNDTPKVVIVKNRDGSSDWTFNFNLTPTGALFGQLNTTSALSQTTWMGGTSSVVSMLFENSNLQNANGNDYIAYCFAEVEGFSNFGSYVGTGVNNTIVTGFEPAFLIVKRTQGAGNWLMFDNKRNPSNPLELNLDANNSEAEENNVNYRPSFLENGFSIGGTSAGINANGETYIYMAFAADPTTVEPTLEDSFNTVTYTGNQSTQSITGVGFQPDFTWLKGRDSTWNHLLYDSVRGVNKELHSNTTDSEGSDVNILQSFDNNGFTLGSSGEGNFNGQDYVAWNWKGAELPAINSNGSIPSVVSANPAAGFSIVSYTGNGNTTGESFGHGLSQRPSMVIVKNRTSSGTGWNVLFPDFMTSGQYLALNLTNEIKNSVNSGWGGSLPDSNKVYVGGSSWTNTSGDQYVAYCFAEVAGFSKFGSYTGTGGVLPEQTLGFEPAFIMFKRTDSTGDWFIYDNKRDTTDPRTVGLYANLSAAEYNTSGSSGYADINFLPNGFSMNANYVGINASGGTFIYMAFANQF